MGGTYPYGHLWEYPPLPGIEYLRSRIKTSISSKPPGGYFLVKDYWGGAAGWGRIFTTRLTIMELHF